ncbi:MAG: PadR family transcriptional regulator [Actinomycetes bacterium]
MTSDEIARERERRLRSWHERHHERRARREGRGRGRRHEHGGGHRQRPSDRARRGDVRAAMLLALQDAPMHGYQLIQVISERSGGLWEPSPGAIYPALALLEDEGLVTISVDGGRKMASLTDAGRSYIEENRDALGDPFTVQGGPSPALREIGDLMRDLMIASKVLARSADDGQLAKLRDLLAQTRRDFYRILGDDT